jgi:hypothetical protein
MAIQRRFGNANPSRQASRSDALARAHFEHVRERFENMLAAGIAFDHNETVYLRASHPSDCDPPQQLRRPVNLGI